METQKSPEQQLEDVKDELRAILKNPQVAGKSPSNLFKIQIASIILCLVLLLLWFLK